VSVGPSATNQNEALLVGIDLCRRFGTTVALNGASIEVKAGEVVAVMGPSGSGKSTLLHCLSCIIRPDAGEVHYDGRRLESLTEEARSRLRREEFGFVFQFGQLVPDLSSLENVSLPLRLQGVRRTVAERQARDWLARLEVEDVVDKRPGEISGGQGQRVAVARALVNSPRVIFADEPTGSLDSLQGEVVMGLLVGAARDEGAAVVLVTHDATVAAYAEREVIVRDGRSSSPQFAS
jgi:putative ABC transport system ATP-binding protein